MIDYAQSFEQFSSSLKPMDLALYGGAGLVLWVLFKEKLSPLQTFVKDLLTKATNTVKSKTETVANSETTDTNGLFFQLVTSWKQTRDLAEKNGCVEAIKVADQMFPYLSPNGCGEKKL